MLKYLSSIYADWIQSNQFKGDKIENIQRPKNKCFYNNA